MKSNKINRNGVVIVSVLASSAVNRGFEHRSSKITDYWYVMLLRSRLRRSIKEKEQRLAGSESGRFGAVKSDSAHHFFRNACTKSGPLRFSQFSGCWLIFWLLIYEFWLSLWKITRCSIILLLPLFKINCPSVATYLPQTVVLVSYDYKDSISSTKRTSLSPSYHCNVTCYHHDIADFFLHLISEWFSVS